MAVTRFLTLEIGASSLRLAEFSSTGKGNLTLLNYGSARLEVDPNVEEDINPRIVAALQKLIAEKGFKARRVAMSVSGQMVLTRFLKLPATEESKIRQMVQYEAAQSVPFPIDEVVWDFQVVGARGGTDLEVVLVAIKSDIVEGFYRSAEQAGLMVEVIDVAPIAMYNALLYNYDIHESTLMLDIGSRTTNLIFIEPTKVFTRSVPVAGNTITQSVAQEFEIPFAEAEELKARQGFVGLGGAYEEPEIESAAKLSKIIRNVMTRLHAEVARSINFYRQQQGGTPPKKLLLAGGTSIIPYSDHFFKEKMEIEVEYFNPFKNIAIQVAPEELEKDAHSMGEVVGLALRLVTECPVEINLVPSTMAKQKAFARKIPFFAASMVGVLCILLSWWLYYWKASQMLGSQLAEITSDVDALNGAKQQLEKAQKDADAVKVQADQIQAAINARYLWLNILGDLNTRVPAEIWITQLIPGNAGRPIALGGVGNDNRPSSPMSGGGAPRRGGGQTRDDGGPTAPVATKEQKGITEFEIRGLCLNNRASAEPLKSFNELRSALIASDYIEAITEQKADSPSATDWTFSFFLRAKLKKAVPY